MATDWNDPNRDLIELGHRCRAIHRAIYAPLSELDAEAWVTAEPVSFAERTTGRHLLLKPGDTWGALWDCAWFHFTGSVPAGSASSGNVVLLIDLNGEGCVVDPTGNPVLGLTTVSSEFDRSHGFPGKRVVPVDQSTGETRAIDVWVEAGCNDLFGGYRNAGSLQQACIAAEAGEVKALYYDFSVLLDLAGTMAPGEARTSLAAALRSASNRLDRITDDRAVAARAVLAEWLERHRPARSDESLLVSACGQAHIDLAWLWPIRETIRKGGRTFATTLALMDRYPEYVFGASQPQLYQWIKERYPSLYRAVRARIAEGRWEPQGAMWVESDVNLAGGESLVRQLLYGKRFYKEEFGFEATIGWLPDDFGFPASLPQILKGAGVDSFMTTKLSWNTVNRFPRTTFWWEGIDGTKVLTHIGPEGNYNSSALPHSVTRIRDEHNDREVSPHALLLFGIGDGGGGPGEEHLERLARERSLPGMPPVIQETAQAFFDRVRAEATGPAPRLPTCSGELYLEKHQGTFTTQGRSKRFNRQLEAGLRDLEWLATVVALRGGPEYPKADLERIWKEVLLYQFHDILPGSSITRVYDESLARYDVLRHEVEDLSQTRAAWLAGSLGASSGRPAYLVTNSLSWPRSEWVAVDGGWRHVSLPSLGWCLLDSFGEDVQTPPTLSASSNQLENEVLRLTFDASGALTSIFDKENGRDILAGLGNVLTLYDDPGDAWDFPPDYRDRPRRRLEAGSVQAFVDGPWAAIHHRYSSELSMVDQTVRLAAGSRRVDFVTTVDWNETHTMLRTAFPISARAPMAAYGIQFGAVYRGTGRTTTLEQAMDEVCGHGWADLGDGAYGVALLSNAKYGYSIHDHVLDLNLLRSPTSPDPVADVGLHEFTYSLYPHAGSWQEAGVVRAAYELNHPIRTVASARSASHPEPASKTGVERFLEVEPANVIVEAIKQAEESTAVIVRLYEAHGVATSGRLVFGFPVRRAQLTNLLEQPEEDLAIEDGQISLEFGPFQIRTLLLTPA